MINNINTGIRLPHTAKRPAAAKTTPETIPDSANNGTRNKSVRINISENAKTIAAALLEMTKSEDAPKSALEQLFEGLRDSEKMHENIMKGIAEQIARQRKAIMIAMRIAAGEDVPAHEREFLKGQATILYVDANLKRLHRENQND